MRKIFTILILIGSVALICGACCATAQKCADPVQRNTTVCAVVNDIVDCTTPQATTLIAEFAPLVLTLVEKLTGADGSIDMSALGADVKSAGIADGMCVIADVFKSLQSKSTAAGGPGKPKLDAVSNGFDQLRSQVTPGVKYKTPHGEI